MAVVPTAHHVTLTYGTTTADQLGKLASLGGVVALGALITMRPPPMRQPAAPSTPAPDRACAAAPGCTLRTAVDEDDPDVPLASPPADGAASDPEDP